MLKRNIAISLFSSQLGFSQHHFIIHIPQVTSRCVTEGTLHNTVNCSYPVAHGSREKLLPVYLHVVPNLSDVILTEIHIGGSNILVDSS